MSTLDLSLSNPKINSYLRGFSDLAPIGELLYVHTHFISPNFLSELEVMINQTAQVLDGPGNNLSLAISLKSYAEALAEQMSEINEDSATQILATLQSIFKLCDLVIKSKK